MKRSSLLPLVPQVALVFAVAYACSDSTAPASSRSLLSPKNPTLVVGDPPPPPVDVAMTVSINSPHIAPFTGVYFTNGNIHDDGLGFTETFDGTAWLRFDNKQPMPDAGDASANTRFMVKGTNDPTGMGTLSFGGIGGVAFKIVRVDQFRRFFGCNRVGETCAIITFTAAIVGGDVCNLETGAGCHTGELTAFNKSECLVVFVPDNDEGVPDHFVFSCPPPTSEP